MANVQDQVLKPAAPAVPVDEGLRLVLQTSVMSNK